MNNNILLVLWDIAFLVGQGHKSVKPSMLRATGDMSRTTIYRHINALVGMGIVYKVGHGRYSLVSDSPFVYDLFDAVSVVNS